MVGPQLVNQVQLKHFDEKWDSSIHPPIKVKVIRLMRYMSFHNCNIHVLISDENIKYIKQYLE